MHKAAAALITGSAVAAAAGAGSQFGPTPAHPRTLAWYARLRKPSFTPPGPVFGIAWTVLDGLLWYAGYRLASRPSTARRNFALGVWGATVLGVGGSPYFLFGRKRLDEALGVTAGMVATTAGLVAASATVDRQAARAAAPLALWVSFAFLLQEEVWRRNRRA
jgi:tryptophan-rich sensory protein